MQSSVTRLTSSLSLVKHLAALLDLIGSETSRTEEKTSLSDTSSTREVVDAELEVLETKPGTAVEPTDDFPAIVFPAAKEEAKPRYPSQNGWATYETTNTRLCGKEEAAAEWKAPSEIKAEEEPVWTGFSKVRTQVVTTVAAGTLSRATAEAHDADKAVPLASVKTDEPEWKGFSKVRGQQLQRGSSAPNARTSSSKLVANGCANATPTATSLAGKQETMRLATAPRATTTSLPPQPTDRIIEWKGFNEDAARGGFESIFKSERPVPAFPPAPLPTEDAVPAPSKPSASPPQPLPSARTGHDSVAPPLRTRIESSTRAIRRRSSFDEPPRPHPNDMRAMPPISIAGRAARDKERKEGGGHTLEPEMDIIHTSYQPKGWRTSRLDRATNGRDARGRTGSEDDEYDDEEKEDDIEEEESDECPEEEPEPRTLRNEWEFEDLVDPYTPEPVKEEPAHPAARSSKKGKKQDEPKFGKIDHGEIAPGWTPNITRREDLRESRETLSLRRFQESTAAIYASTTVLPDFIPEAPSHAPRRNRLADEADMGKPEPSHWVAEEEDQRYERRVSISSATLYKWSLHDKLTCWFGLAVRSTCREGADEREDLLQPRRTTIRRLLGIAPNPNPARMVESPGSCHARTRSTDRWTRTVGRGRARGGASRAGSTGGIGSTEARHGNALRESGLLTPLGCSPNVGQTNDERSRRDSCISRCCTLQRLCR